MLIKDLEISRRIYFSFCTKNESSENALNNIFASEIVLYFLYPIISNRKVLHIKLVHSILKASIKFFRNKFIFLKVKKNISISELNNSILILAFTKYMYIDNLRQIALDLSENSNHKIIVLYDHKDNVFFQKEKQQFKHDNLNFINIQQINFKNTHKKYSQNPFNYFFNLNLINFIAACKYILYLNNIFYLNISRQIAELQNLVAIISTDTNDIRCRSIIYYSNLKKIKSIELQYGLYGKEAIEFSFFYSDYLLVWGQYFKEIFENLGVPKEKIIVAGSPRFSYKHEKIFINKNLKYKTILFAPTHKNKPSIPLIVNKMNEDFIKLVNLHPDVKFYIKLHPLDTNSFRYFDIPTNLTFLENDVDFRRYIRDCDVFISCGSTLTIDSIVNKKPTIVFDYEGWEDFTLPLKIFKNILFVKNLSDLHTKLCKVKINEYFFNQQEIIDVNTITSNKILELIK
jgi:hypothetical protein